MAADEAEVLVEFYRTHPQFEVGARYDVRLRAVDPEWPLGLSEDEREMWRLLTAKRPDVVWEMADARYVVEVTPRIGKAAIGGVMVYASMLAVQEPDVRPVRRVIVTGWDDAALVAEARLLGIEVYRATPPSWVGTARPPPFDRAPVWGR